MRDLVLAVRPGTRTTIVGRTGSGKTTFAIWLAQTVAGGLIVDTKGERLFDRPAAVLPDALRVDGLELTREAEDAIGHGRWVVLRPPAGASADELDDALGRVIDDWENLTVLVDELYSFHTGGRPGPRLVELYTRGRSRGQSVIGCSQRPRWLSLFAFSEADHLAVFSLNVPDDRKRIYDFVGDPRVLGRLPAHAFWWYSVADDQLVRCAPIAPISKRA